MSTSYVIIVSIIIKNISEYLIVFEYSSHCFVIFQHIFNLKLLYFI